MDRIELADGGGWIDLRNPEELTEGERQDFILILNETERTSPMRVDFAVTNAIKGALISAWNIPYLPEPTEIPAAGPERVKQLRMGDARLLDPYARKTWDLLFPKPASVDDYEDPSSPTEPANG